MGYQRQTWVLRAGDGRGMGFLVYERGERQDTLRCQCKGFAPDSTARLLAVDAQKQELEEIGELRFTKTGGAEQSFSLAGNARMTGAIVTDATGRVLAVGWSAGSDAWPAERVQLAVRALLMPEPKQVKRATRERPDLAQAQGVLWPPQWTCEHAVFDALPVHDVSAHLGWQCALSGRAADPRGLAVRVDQGWIAQMAAICAGQSWPPPPGMCGARFAGGVWLAPLTGADAHA